MPYKTMKAGHALAEAIRDQHFPDRPILTVRRTGSLQVGMCYNNVRQTMARKGGSAQLGFVLCWFPGHLVEALHHAVWVSPAGELEDVTQRSYTGMNGSKIAFIPTDGDLGSVFDPTVSSVFLQLDSADGTADYIELVRERQRILGQIVELMKAHMVVRRLPDGRMVADGSALPLHVQTAYSALASNQTRVDGIIRSYRARMAAGNFRKI